MVQNSFMELFCLIGSVRRSFPYCEVYIVYKHGTFPISNKNKKSTQIIFYGYFFYLTIYTNQWIFFNHILQLKYRTSLSSFRPMYAIDVGATLKSAGLELPFSCELR